MNTPMTQQSITTSLAGLAAALLITACGGGGSASPNVPVVANTAASTVSVANTTATMAVADTTPNVTVSVPIYAAGSDAMQVFDQLNAIRIQIGLGPQSQDLKLDLAAKGHADWMALNMTGGHVQTVGSIGFTGGTPFDRVTKSGYLYDTTKAGAVMEAISTATAGVPALYSVRQLFNAPYHAIEFMSAHRDVGIGVGEFSYVTNSLIGGVLGTSTVTQFYLAYNFSTKLTESRQLTGTDTVTIYPCNGVTNVDYSLINETPNPVPGRNLAAFPLGTSVAVRVREGQVLTLSSATMTKISDGSTVQMRTPITQKNDPNLIYLDASSGFISADAPMLPLTQYRTVVTGANDGRAFTKTCDFTTGA